MIITLLGAPVLAATMYYGLGKYAVWVADRYVAAKRAEGYAVTLNDFHAQKRNEWQAARDASPLRTASVRLSLYGARVARLTMTTGLVNDPGEVDYAYWMQFPLMRTSQLEEEAQSLEQQLSTGHVILPEQPAPLHGEPISLIMPANIQIRQWRRHLPGTNGRFMAYYERTLLEMDRLYPLQHINTINQEDEIQRNNIFQRVFLAHRAAFLLLGWVEEAVALWEESSRMQMMPPGLEDSYSERKRDTEMLGSAIRYGAFQEGHLRRLLASTVYSADQLRDSWNFTFQRKVAMLGLCTGDPYRRNFALEIRMVRLWQTGISSVHSLKEVLPNQMNLIILKAECEIDEQYHRDLQALRGTQQWPEPPETGPNRLFELLSYIRNKPDWTTSYSVALDNNLRLGLLAFALYKVRTGKVPATLSEFMDAEPAFAEKLIHIPHVELVYSTNSKGVANLEIRADKLRKAGIWTRNLIVYEPRKTPARFPLLPKEPVVP
ncbi:MAG: hypothetical protein ACAI35_02070 [Candidatus Methylacidiphilales bacterium]